MPSARNARTRRSHVVAAARISQRSIRTALPRRVGRIPAGFRTAIQWQTRRVTNRRPDDPGPCRRCAAALSAADAPTYISLGSHPKSGPPMRRSPRRAVPCGHRNGASLSATDATNPAARRRGSTHPDRRMRGWNRGASPWRVGRIPAGFRTAIQWQTRRVTNRPSEDPGPCRRCASALSAADAPTYISLGSHPKSGPPMRRSPRRAVPCGHRHGASLSPTDATNPAVWRRGSTHPDHRMRGWNRVLPAGENRIANGWGADGEPRIGSSGQTGSGQRYQQLSAHQDLRSCRMCSNRTPNLGCAWVAHRDAGSPIRHARKT